MSVAPGVRTTRSPARIAPAAPHPGRLWVDRGGLSDLRLAVAGAPPRAGGWPGVWASLANAGKHALGTPEGRPGRAERAGSGPRQAAGAGAGADVDARGGRSRSTSPEQLVRIEALVELAQGGDAEAFGQIYEAYVDVVYRYAYVRCGSHHLAEDITAETFVRALKRLDTFTWTGKDIAAWFVTIARNLMLDHVKSSRYRMEITTGELLDADAAADAPETEVLERMRDQQLLTAVKALRPEQQECIVLRFLQGMSLAETAAILGRKENAVKQLQLRAVRALHRAMAGEQP